MPRYEDGFLNCEQEISELEQDYEKASGRTRFMLRRKLSELVYISNLQIRNVHTLQGWVNSAAGGYGVCNCGLILEDSKDVTMVQGHLFSGNVIQQIIYDAGPELGFHLICLDCRITHPVLTKSGEAFFAIPNVDVERTLAQHQDCRGSNVGG